MAVVPLVINDLGSTHHKAAVLDSFRANEPIRQTFHSLRSATKYDHLKTCIVIEVRVQGRNNNLMALMLDVSEPFRKKTGVVIVDESDSSNDQGVSERSPPPPPADRGLNLERLPNGFRIPCQL